MFSSGCVAQLVEQLTLNQWVQGSSPCASTRNNNRHLWRFYFCVVGVCVLVTNRLVAFVSQGFIPM